MTAIPHRYRAFELSIASDFEFPELVPEAPSGNAADVVVKRVDTARHFPPRGEAGQFVFGDEESFLLYPEVGAFRLIGTDLIEVEPRPGTDPALVAFPLLGPLMGLLLRARGALVLHGSALEVAGEGVGFLGDKGAGKSTTAGALVRAGHGLLTDDILALQGIGSEVGGPAILPAFPQVKLADAAASELALAGVRQRPAVAFPMEKERFALGNGFAARPVPVSRFYLLRRGGEPGIIPLAPKVRMKALLRFSYVSRFGPQAMTKAAAARHVRHCAGLAERARVAILTVPADLKRLGEIADLVAADSEVRDDAA